MALPMYYHLNPDDYVQHCPEAVDELPCLIDKRTYLDAWIFNRMYDTIQNLETWILDNKAKIEVTL